MTDIEDRLRDAFGALDRQVVVPPRREVHAARRVASNRVLALAAAVAIVAGTAFVLTRSSERDTTRVAGEVASETFEAVATPVCRRIIDARGGVAPRFATVEAYVLVAEHRIDLIGSALASLAALPEHPDDPGFRDRVLHTFREATARAQIVLDAASAGAIDRAVSGWPRVDQYIDLGLRLLADRGVDACAI
jgi:hypothetical protein